MRPFAQPAISRALSLTGANNSTSCNATAEPAPSYFDFFNHVPDFDDLSAFLRQLPLVAQKSAERDCNATSNITSITEFDNMLPPLDFTGLFESTNSTNLPSAPTMEFTMSDMDVDIDMLLSSEPAPNRALETISTPFEFYTVEEVVTTTAASLHVASLNVETSDCASIGSFETEREGGMARSDKRVLEIADDAVDGQPVPKHARLEAVSAVSSPSADSVLVLPPSSFRALVKSMPELSPEERRALGRDRRRALNRSYQQRSRQRKAAELDRAQHARDTLNVYASGVHELAHAHFGDAKNLAAFLESVKALEAATRLSEC